MVSVLGTSFAALSAAQVAGLRGAVLGLTSDHMAALASQAPDASSCEGFNGEQTMQMGLRFGSSLSQKHICVLDKHSAELRRCSSCARVHMHLPVRLSACPDPCRGMVGSCVASLPNGAIYYLACLSEVPPHSFANLSVTQVGDISRDGMASLTAEQLATLGPQCASFTLEQTETMGGVDGAACSGISPVCSQHIPASSMAGFSSNCVSMLPLKSVAALSVEQVSAWDSHALAGLTGAQLMTLWADPAHGSAIAEQWGNSANYIPDLTLFIAAVDAGIIPPIPAWSSITDLQQQSALQLARCPVECMSALFASGDSVLSLSGGSWAGLRAAHMRVIGAPPADGGTIPPSASVFGSIAWIEWWRFIPNGTIASVSADQLRAIPQNGFQGMLLPNLNPAVLATGLKLDQLYYVRAEAVAQLSCAAYGNLTDAQVSMLARLQPVAMAGRAVDCPRRPDPTPPSPASPSSSLSIQAIIAITAGATCVGTLILVAMAYFCCFKKPSAPQTLQQSLLQR
jgi:hypothetical protein